MSNTWKRRGELAFVVFMGGSIMALIGTDASSPFSDFIAHVFWGCVFFPVLVMLMDAYRELMKPQGEKERT